MKGNRAVYAIVTVCFLLLSGVGTAAADEGPAAAEGFGRPYGAYDQFGPNAYPPSRNVSGNAAFKAPERDDVSVTRPNTAGITREEERVPSEASNDDDALD